jgi:hypothetical protein
MCLIKIHSQTIQMPSLAEADEFFADSRHALELRQAVEARLLEGEARIELDFTGVRNTTQSWMNAFIGNLVLVYGKELANRVVFKGCNDTLKALIKFVYGDAMGRRETHQISEH